MPIRPENRARYPADWPEISTRIRARARGRCEGSPDFPECSVHNGSIGYRDGCGAWIELARGDMQTLAELQFDHGDLVRLTRIVLTVAHLDHQPEHCDDDNLRAMCQRCHLHYDRHHHAETAYRTRRVGRVIADLFGESHAG